MKKVTAYEQQRKMERQWNSLEIGPMRYWRREQLEEVNICAKLSYKTFRPPSFNAWKSPIAENGRCMTDFEAFEASICSDTIWMRAKA